LLMVLMLLPAGCTHHGLLRLAAATSCASWHFVAWANGVVTNCRFLKCFFRWIYGLILLRFKRQIVVLIYQYQYVAE
jgi:hypothetical protein